MSVNCNKVNREKTWPKEIFAPAKVFSRLVDYVVNATYHRHILTGPGLFCEGCLFSDGRVPPTPVFFFNQGGLSTCGTKVLNPGPIIMTLRKRVTLCSLHARFFPDISLDRIVLRWRPTRAVQRGSRQVRGLAPSSPLLAL